MTPTEDAHGGLRSYVATSERVDVASYSSSIGGYLIYCFHVATYEFSRPYAVGQRVLDLGCGTGYGSHSLAADSTSVTGVDISADAIAYAAKLRAPNLTFQRIEPVQHVPLPFPNSSFDLVVSFQVIEHIVHTNAYLSEILRVLASGGTFICATPDRTTRLFRKQRPWNAFHVHEYSPAELQASLQRIFAEVDLYGMTAPSGVIDIELRRTRRIRLVSMPFTFPGAPESWRVRGLTALNRLTRNVLPSRRPTEPVEYGFTPSDISISPDAVPSVSIVAVARV